MLFFAAGCEKHEPAVPGDGRLPDVPDRVTLIYAVNNSSLMADFNYDRKEMETALKEVNPRCVLLVYCIETDASSSDYRKPVLLCPRYSSDGVKWNVVKRYDNSVPSVDETRIGTVIGDALSLFPDSPYDLVFWGHGSAWYAPKPRSAAPVPDAADRPECYAYGGEYTDFGSGTPVLWADVDRMAEAIPDSRFDTIWFDCCYMSNIETIYEFSGKCDTFVAYPTEVWSDGLAYDRMLKYMMRGTPDVIGAANDFYNGYAMTNDPVTVAVVDMAGLEELADISQEILAAGDNRPAKSQLVLYSRSSSYAFYDFGAFMRLTAQKNLGNDDAAGLLRRFDAAMGNVVKMHAASPVNFNGAKWDVENISGLSTHYFENTDKPSDDFYRSLKWYSRVYQ